MKKLLLVLTVVVMASFLLVGCFGTEENTAPVITTIALPNATAGVPYTATVAATDADDDALTFSLVTGPTDMVMSEAGVISGWTPAAEGTEPVTVAVTDGTDSVSADFTITIDAAPVEHVAPEIAAIDDQTIVWGEEFEHQVTLDAGTDLTPTYSLAATRVANAIGLEISATGLITWTPLEVQKGLYEVTVTATDTVDSSLSDTEVFTILVVDPEPEPVPAVPPTVDSLLPLEATVGEVYTGEVTATAGDAAIASYALTDPPAGMTIVAATGLITWTPTAAGSFDVTVVVTDADGESGTEVFTIVVDDRVAPEIAAIDDQTIVWGEEFEHQVTLDAGTDLTPTYSLAATRVANAIGLEISATGLITWTPLEVQKGLYEVTVTATDTVDSSLSDTEVFTILVVDPEPPAGITVESIVYEDDHSYNDGTTQFVRGGSDCVGVEVELSEAIGEDDEVYIRWNDGSRVDSDTGWEPLTADTANKVFTGDLCFDGQWDACMEVCVELKVVTFTPVEGCTLCEPLVSEEVLYAGNVTVDSAAPTLSLDITFENCESVCGPGAKFTFKPKTYDATCPACGTTTCCDEDSCSGIAFWSIVDSNTCDPCGVEATGLETCPDGTFECGCLLFADGHDDWTGAVDTDEQITYNLKFTFADNVGNAIVDTWAITVDTDSVVGFVNNAGGESNQSAVETLPTVNIPYTTCGTE